MSRRLTALLLALCLVLSTVVVAFADPNDDSGYAAARETLSASGLSSGASVAMDAGAIRLPGSWELLDEEETPALPLSLLQLTVRILQCMREEEQQQTQQQNESVLKAAADAAVLVQYDGVIVTADEAALLRADAAEDAEIEETEENAALTEEPEVIRTLAGGKVARLLDLADGFYRVEFDGQEGLLPVADCEPVHYEDYEGTAATSMILEDLVAYACTYIGTRYVYGGSSYRGIDCSGFTMRVFGHFGYNLPHAVTGQYAMCRRVSDSERRPGDLVFFNTTGGLSHVGIYLGGGRFIHAGSITGVAIRSLSEPYFARCYLFCGRLIG
ncbi:MAG: C40 family peptidase [Oscillospiraceae bacterium]|nr:C40 family peptidase [Oscillospiraceae bacterium]